MNVIQNNINEVNATLVVQVSAADYAEKLDKAVKDFRKNVNLPGFRKGMAPVGLIKKSHGKALLAEEINKIVSNSLYSYIQEKELNILGEPLPAENEKEQDFAEGNDFEFTYEIALAPALNIDWNNNNSINYYKIDIDSNLVDKQLAAYKGRYGKHIQAEDGIIENDIAKGELVELNEDGSIKEDGLKVENAMLSPKHMKNDEQKAAVLGVAKEGTFTFNPKVAFENEAEIASLLQITKEEAAEFTANCLFTVKEITRFVEAEMNQDLFDAAFGKDEVKSEEEFLARIKAGLEDQFVADSDIKFLIDMRAWTLEQLKDTLFADEFLKRWLKLNNEKMTDEQIESDYPKMIEDLKWQLLKDTLLKDNNAKIEKEDVEAVAKVMAKAQFAQYGMLNAPDAVLDNYVQEMLKNQDGLRNASERAAENKAIAIMKEKVQIVDQTVSFEEFNKFFQTENN